MGFYNPENYPLSEAFDHAFRHIVEENSRINKDEARNRELTAYGRCDFRNGTDTVSAYEQIQLYNCYYMRRAYSAHVLCSKATEAGCSVPSATYRDV